MAIIMIFILLNTIGLITMYTDKKRAQNNKWRVSEKRIWLISGLGGATGVYVGMKLFRHKTNHKNFVIITPILIVINIFSYGYLILGY